MKILRRRKWCTSFGIAVAGILASWLVVHIRRLKEPSYQGRRLTEWLGDCSVYPPNGFFGESPRAFNPSVPAASHAVEEIGTNAIPVLLRMLQAGDSTTELKIKLNVLLERQSIIRFRFRPGCDQRNLAVFGFEILNKEAAPAVPALIGLLNSEHPMTRIDVIYALGKIGPAAKDAVAALLTHLNDEHANVRNAVTNVLKQIDPEAAAKAGIK